MANRNTIMVSGNVAKTATVFEGGAVSALAWMPLTLAYGTGVALTIGQTLFLTGVVATTNPGLVSLVVDPVEKRTVEGFAEFDFRNELRFKTDAAEIAELSKLTNAPGDTLEKAIDARFRIGLSGILRAGNHAQESKTDVLNRADNPTSLGGKLHKSLGWGDVEKFDALVAGSKVRTNMYKSVISYADVMQRTIEQACKSAVAVAVAPARSSDVLRKASSPGAGLNASQPARIATAAK